MPDVIIRPVASRPVVVRITQPKIVVPQPKVIVKDTAPPWLSYGVPLGSLVFAFIAALFAVLSWLRMQGQIDLAKQQIKLANKQIDQQDAALALGLQDYEATTTALQITTRQAELADAERAKLPELRLLLNDNYPELEVQGGRRLYQIDPDMKDFTLTVELVNTGKRVANAISVEIVLPKGWNDNSTSAGYERNDAYRFESAPEGLVGTITLERPLVPATSVRVGVIFASAKPGQYKLQWMAKTAEGFFTYPSENAAGMAEFDVKII